MLRVTCVTPRCCVRWIPRRLPRGRLVSVLDRDAEDPRRNVADRQIDRPTRKKLEGVCPKAYEQRRWRRTIRVARARSCSDKRMGRTRTVVTSFKLGFDPTVRSSSRIDRGFKPTVSARVDASI